MIEPFHRRNALATSELDDAIRAQDLSGQARNGERRDLVNGNPLSVPGQSALGRPISEHMNSVIGNGDRVAECAPVRGAGRRMREVGPLREFPHSGHQRHGLRPLDQPDSPTALMEEAPDFPALLAGGGFCHGDLALR